MLARVKVLAFGTTKKGLFDRPPIELSIAGSIDLEFAACVLIVEFTKDKSNVAAVL